MNILPIDIKLMNLKGTGNEPEYRENRENYHFFSNSQ